MQFEWIEGESPGFEAVKAIRTRVFVEEQGFTLEAEFDEQDGNCLHLLAKDEKGNAAATARLLNRGAGLYKIGRMAVLPQYRGAGLGLCMMRQAVEKAGLCGARKIRLNAQADKTAFYERAGFSSTEEENLDEGRPHVWMEHIL